MKVIFISDDEQNLLKDINENTLIEYEKEEVIENEKGARRSLKIYVSYLLHIQY